MTEEKKNLIPQVEIKEEENKFFYYRIDKGNNMQLGILDPNNRIMCTEENNNYPINKIIINNNEKSPTDFNYVTLSLNNNKFLLYTDESINNNIIVNFSISSGIPCLNPIEINNK